MSNVAENRYEESPKRVKYDRQLRLWDDHGQYALEAAHVCLINASATGTEILKSLVLPGVGAFTILDPKIVTGDDVGNNFFLDKDSIGKSRAKVATELLLDLNSDVRGEFVDESLECILQADPNFFSKFTVVIATNLEEATLLQLAGKLWDQRVPLLVCRAYGMIGYMRLQFTDRAIVESRPENEFHDLRLDKPFNALKAYSNSINLVTLTDTEHAHVPFVILLLKHLDSWREKHGGDIPKNMKEKNALKDLINASMRKNDEENFEEACKAVNGSISKTTVPSEIRAILNDPNCEELTPESKSFWILVKALKEFVDNEGQGCLPVRGVIPDMTSDTNSYIKLQNIYRAKAEEDAQVIYRRAQDNLCRLGKPPNSISEQEVKVFCKNAHCLRVLRGRSIEEEYNPKTSNVKNLVADLEHEDSDIIFYVLLRAADRFYHEYRRYPGQNNEDVEADIVRLKNIVTSLMSEWGCSPIMKDDYVHEMCRFGASELHSVAAFVGGCAAHEVIKLITGQYVPFNNTFTYFAVNHTTSVFCL
ncbi:hypothetical protein JTE90_014140 [Oedothorax gibbosus]|uniref:NEDD8-activating enzyme E1 regulatory subunit n=1 Tax=Oedothorax gibbosus TaxID=931172 RepID=A0AAV6VJ09_9ARAC|nr:hypothetical protein JTE90_014140 [Oedothorax gibbosus]